MPYGSTIQAGDLLSRVTIQKQGGLDSHGEPDTEWVTEFSSVPAFIEQQGGSKKLGGDREWNTATSLTQEIPVETHRVTIRYIRGLDSTRRVVWVDDGSTKVLQVLSVSDLESRHIWLTLSCKELVGVVS